LTPLLVFWIYIAKNDLTSCFFMQFNIITIFPEFFKSPLECGLLKKAIDSSLISFSFINPRDFTNDVHRSVDDRPYGGGAGMVMMIEPLDKAISSIANPGKILLLSPRGRVFNQSKAQELSKEESITLICGRYEGIDERIEELYDIERISIGDFVLNGGEAAALCVVEAVARFIPGFMGKEESTRCESFANGLLEHPHYTRPAEYKNIKVPQVLLSGNHREIERWRRESSLKETFDYRPDLLEDAKLLPEDYGYLRRYKNEFLGRSLYVGLVHYPVLRKDGKETAVSLTNLDIHDIARVCKTYGIGGYYLITPIIDQQNLAKRLINHWVEGPAKGINPDREKALRLVHIVDYIETAIEDIKLKTGMEPFIVTTSARDEGELGLSVVRKILKQRPVFLLFGTGHGLSKRVMEMAHGILKPIRAFDPYRHLSVRSAASIIIDRILKDVY